MEGKSTLYSLTSAQGLLLYAQKFCIKKCVNNIATTIVFNENLDLTILKQAIKEAVNRNEGMRLRLVKVGKEVKQYFVPTEDKEVEYMDFTGYSEEKMDNVLHKLAGKAFKLYDSSLNKIVIYKSFDGWIGIFLNVHHTTMDSYSIMMFYKDVMDIYFSHKNNTTYPKPLSSYVEVLKKELQYEANSKAKQEDLKFWQEKFKMEPGIYTDVRGSKILEDYRKKKKNPKLRSSSMVSLLHVKAKHEVFHVDKEMKDKMLEFCVINKVSLQNVIAMALRTYLSKTNGNEEDVSFNATANRRGTIQEKRCGGSRVMCFPFRTIIENDKTFLEGIEIIRDNFNLHFRHSNFAFMELTEMKQEAYGISKMESYESICLTYSPVQIEFKNMKCRSNWICNGAASQNIYLTVMHNILTGGLDFYFEYKVATISLQLMQDIFDSMIRMIKVGIENPNITIIELLTCQNLGDSVNESGRDKTATIA